MIKYGRFFNKMKITKKEILLFSAALSISVFTVTDTYAFKKSSYYVPSLNKSVGIVGGEIVVKTENIGAINAALGTSVIEKLKIENTYRLRIPSGETETSILQKIASMKNVQYAEPNYLVKAFAAPNDPGYTSQWALQNTSWYIAYTNSALLIPSPSAVTIAIVDSGVDWNHPDLAPVMKFNTSDTYGDGSDNDNNGYIDDYYGFNALCGQDKPTNATDTQDAEYYASERRPYDTCGHGTHVAGIAAAVDNNSIGIAGVCWAATAKIMAVKVLDSSGSGSSANVASGIRYAADNRANVINLSLGSPVASQVIKEAIDYAISKNCVVVAAAGNDDDSALSYPAAFNNVIAVGATNTSDLRVSTLTWGSNYGAALDVVAPGDNIYSTYAVYEATGAGAVFTYDIAPTYLYESGTSMASPFVAGLAALILSQNPSLSHTEVEKKIEGHCDDLQNNLQNIGWDEETGWGRVNVYRALDVNDKINAIYNSIYVEPKLKSFPNPFYPRKHGNVSIQLPEKYWGQKLKVTIYNFSGIIVRILDDASADATPNRGLAVWDGRNDRGDFVASGLYYYVADTGAKKLKGKITLIK